MFWYNSVIEGTQEDYCNADLLEVILLTPRHCTILICLLAILFMGLERFGSILKMYQNCDKLVRTGKFGKGLWPVDPEVGQFMNWLIKFYGLKNGLEIGAGVGLSTAWLNEAFVKTMGKLLSFEYFLPKVEQWEKHMSGIFGENYEINVELVPSDFGTWIKNVGRMKYVPAGTCLKGRSCGVDFVFFDQRKEDYLKHLKLILPRLKKGAFICADNVISHAEACQDYLDFVRKEKRFQSVCLKIGAGLELTRLI